MLKKLFGGLLITGLVIFGFNLPTVATPVLRVLIFSGQNNHDWRTTTPKLKSILEAGGQFSVAVTEHPEQCDAATFQKYDVILSNWNTFGDPVVTNWPTAARNAFLNFIRDGKGFVSVHAGSSSFYDWPEYQQLAGGSWKNGQTYHASIHQFTVKLVNKNHPITAGLVDHFSTTDELWNHTALQTNIVILATAYSTLESGGSGRDEPIAFTTTFGQGCSFNLLLGHNVRGMDTPGFQQLLRRGTEWAATGKVSAITNQTEIHD